MSPRSKPSFKEFVLQFNKFFDIFSAHFECRGRSVSAAIKDHVSGMLQQISRKNIERINEQCGQSNYDAQHHAVSKSDWSDKALNRDIAQSANEQIGGKESVLLIDESGFHKQGSASVGVARQYNGRLGKVDNCQVGVFATLSRGPRQCLIGARLFLHKNWFKSKKRCKKAGVPRQVSRVYTTKPQLGIELVDEARATGVKFGMVGADAAYGSSEFSHALDSRGIAFSLGIKSDQRVYRTDPQPFVPQRKSSKGPAPEALISRQRTSRVSVLAKKIKKEQWQSVSVWKGSKGHILVQAYAQRVYFWNSSYPYAPSLWWLGMIREQGSSDIDFFISNAPADISLQSLVQRHRRRYWVERSFQDCKSCLGMAQYQIRTWRAWHHHISLCMLAHLFLLTLKRTVAGQWPLLSCEDIIQVMHFFLFKRIATEKDLTDAIEKRHRQRREAQKSALRCQKRNMQTKSKVPK